MSPFADDGTDMRAAQKAAVERYHSAGMNRRDLDAVVAQMADDVAWFSVDATFQRRWYRGIDEIRLFLTAMFENTQQFTFALERVIADPDVPDTVVAEWTNSAVMGDGSGYENRGCTVFLFSPGSSMMNGIVQYFDWGPLMARADWRASMERAAGGAQR